MCSDFGQSSLMRRPTEVKLRTSPLYPWSAAGLVTLAGLAALLGDGWPTIVTVLLLAAAAYCLLRATWTIRVAASALIFGGVLHRREPIQLDAIVRSDWIVYSTWFDHLIIPRDHRQCLLLGLRDRREVRLDAFWRRPPWGDEAALHPTLAEFIKVVTARLADSPATVERGPDAVTGKEP
jgi:hypothetical protein